MKKIAALLLLACIFKIAGAQQQVLLMSDTFNAANTGDVSFDFQAVGGNYGDNDWTINANYNGSPVYPNTINEDSVLGGLGNISHAPYSSYLHIHDTTDPSGVANANWNHSHASDRFCILNNQLCTSGLTNVSFAFFWTAGGDSTAYGQVYYSNDGANWLQTGRPKYYNQHNWAYEVIQDTNFNNQQNLFFGFRWLNSGTDTTTDASFAIDDIIAAGTYTPNDTSFHILSVTPDTNCQNASIIATFSLNPALCDGSYDAVLSDGSGNFQFPTTLQYPFNLNNSSTVWQTQFYLPGNVTGSCFRIILKRVGPAPILQSDTSACFTIQQCPFSIVTNNAPVITDVDTACVNSAVDVYFNSYGALNNNNVYTAQLSDSNGSFAHPDTIGTLVSSIEFNGAPGSVPGKIPANTPPGCGYRIRVVSSSPYYVGNAIGPFCLKRCDVTTNHATDIHACINYPYPSDTVQLVIADNQWGQGASYDTCNNWTIELLDMMTFNIVNIGGLGVYHDSVSGTFTLIVGPASTLPVAPGTYYMRIISNCSNEPWNETGTVVRLSVGAPAVSPQVSINATQQDSVYCNTSSMELYAEPYNPASNYFWSSNYFNPIEAPAVLVNLNSPLVGNFTALVQEENFGCYGPYSTPYNFIVTTAPHETITGPTKVCPGDTVVFDAAFYPATYYTWPALPGVSVVLQSNTQVSMVFDSLGTLAIAGESVNACGSSTGQHSINVIRLFDVDTMPNKTVCLGDSVTLTGVVPPYPQTFISLDSSIISSKGGMFNLHVHNDIIIDSFAVTFRSQSGTAQIDIYSKQGSYRGFEQSAASWDSLAINIPLIPSTHPNVKTVIPVELNKTIAAGDTVAFYITANTSSGIDLAIGSGTGIQQGIVFKSDGVIDFIQGTQNAYPFGASSGPRVLDVTVYYRTLAGLHYLWNNGDTTDAITLVPAQSAQYIINVSQTTGCRSSDTLKVIVDTLCNVGVRNIASNPLIQIYPNPTSGSVNMVIDNARNAITTVQVTNSLDQLVGEERYEAANNFTANYDLTLLPSGLYFFKVTVGERVEVFQIALTK